MMMEGKLICFCLLAILAAATPEFERTEKVFRPGVEYTYKYDSQVLSGIPNSDNQYSGLKLIAKAKIQIQEDHLAVLKLEDIELYEINDNLKTALPTEILPERIYREKKQSEHIKVMVEHLRIPVAFKYERGSVTELKSEKSDHFWSVNIKRGVLNLLQISLTQEREVSEIYEPQMFEYPSFKNVIATGKNFDKIYKVTEDDVMGECETLYAIHQREPDFLGKEQLKVTQVKDYKNCKEKVFYEQGLFGGLSYWLAIPKEMRSDLVTPISHTDYELSGERDSFLITKIRSHSDYIFTPYQMEGGSMVTYIRQNFDLIKTEPVYHKLSISEPVEHLKALQLHLPQSLAKLDKEVYGQYEDSWSKVDKEEDWTKYEAKTYWEKYNLERDSEVVDSFSQRHQKSILESMILQKKINTESSEIDEDRSYEENVNAELSYFGKTKKSKLPKFEKDESSSSSSSSSESDDDSSSISEEEKEDTITDILRLRGTNKVEMVFDLLKKIDQSMYPVITEETSLKVIILNRLMQELSSEELAEVVFKVTQESSFREPEFKRQRELILDILPVIPKPIIPKIITALVSRNIIYPKRGAYMLALYIMTAPPSPAHLKSMLRVCRHPGMHTDSQLYKTCVLGIGTFIRQLYAIHIKAKIPISSSFGVFEEGIEELKNLLTTSRTEEKKLLALKAIGNAGLPQFLRILKEYSVDRTQPKFIRSQALYSIRKFAAIVPQEVRKIVLPLYMDTHEPSEVRIPAFALTMLTQPNDAVMEMISHHLNSDPSLDVRSFVYSFLRSEAKTNLPHKQQFSYKARRALILAKPVLTGLDYSKAYSWDVYNDNLDMGLMADIGVVQSEESSLPYIINGRFGATLSGQHINLLDTTLKSRRLEDVFTNLYNTRSLWKKVLQQKFSIPELARLWDVQEFGSTKTIIDEILEKVNIRSRMTESPLLQASLKLFNNEVGYVSVDSKMVKEFLSFSDYLYTMYKSDPNDVMYPVHLTKTLFLGPFSYVTPTPIGIPLGLNFTMVGLVSVNGHVELRDIPSIKDLLFRSSEEPMKILTHLNTSFSITMKGKMGVDANVLRTSAVFEGQMIGKLPIKSELNFNVKSMKASFKWDIPQKPLTLLKTTFKLYTEVIKLSLHKSQYESSRTRKEIHNRQVTESKKVEFETEIPAVGVKVGIKGEFSLRKPVWAPFFPLSGKQVMRLYIKPTEDKPKKVVLKLFAGPTSFSSFSDILSTVQSSNVFDFSESSESSEIVEKRESELETESSWFSSKKDRNYRTASRDMTVSDLEDIRDEFVPVTPFSEISKPRARYFGVVLEAEGGRKERSLQTKVTWFHCPYYQVHQLNVQVLGVPLIGSHTSEMRLMTDVTVHVPRLIRYHDVKEADLLSRIQFSYGSHAFTEVDFTLKVHSGSSSYQWQSEYSPLTSYYHLFPVNEKFEYYALLNYERLPSYIPAVSTSVLEMVKAYTFPYIYVQPSYNYHYSQQDGQLKVYFKVVPSYGRLTAVLKTPTEKDIILNYPLTNPALAPHTISVAVPAPVIFRNSSWYYPRSFTGECRMNEHRMSTFDLVDYQMPEVESTCEMIFARDCSSQGLFTVMTSAHYAQKVVRFIVPHYEFKLMPRRESSLDYALYINGELKELIKEQTMMLPQSRDTSSRIDSAFQIKRDGEWIQIRWILTGLVLQTNGKIITLQAPSMFRSRICGLCGNYDYEQSYEYEGPNQDIFEKPEHFAVHYTVPTSQCSLDSLYTKYSVPRSRAYEVRDAEECSPMRRHIVKKTTLHGEEMVCISREPVIDCSNECRRHEVTSKQLSFHCLPQDDTTLTSLVRESKIRVLSELATKKVDYYHDIETPSRCMRM